MMTRLCDAVRFTHLPTGISATAYRDCTGMRGNWVARCSDWALRLLKAKLFSPPISPIKRSYHLHPYLGVEPYVKQGEQVLARGKEVWEFLDGKLLT